MPLCYGKTVTAAFEGTQIEIVDDDLEISTVESIDNFDEAISESLDKIEDTNLGDNDGMDPFI